MSPAARERAGEAAGRHAARGRCPSGQARPRTGPKARTGRSAGAEGAEGGGRRTAPDRMRMPASPSMTESIHNPWHGSGNAGSGVASGGVGLGVNGGESPSPETCTASPSRSPRSPRPSECEQRICHFQT